MYRVRCAWCWRTRSKNDRVAGYAGTFLGSLGLGNGATVFNSLTTLATGAGYTIGDVRLNGLYTQNKIELPASSLTQKNVDLGASWHYNPANALNLGYTHSKLEGARYNQISVSNVYSLSKRTEVYAQAAYQRAGGALRTLRSRTTPVYPAVTANG
ncbi:porin [Undibacterium arcticum]